MERKNCLICNQKKINDIINLGMHPFADTFINRERIYESEDIYPLIVQLCSNCGNIQTKIETPTNERYNKFDYSYTSSNSDFAKNHWKSFYGDIHKKLNVGSNKLIFEIGSNDGYLLKLFKKNKNLVLGIDASSYMTRIANKNKIRTENLIFDIDTSNKILKKYGKADLIIANNVFNHSDNPLNFVKSIKKVLKSEGTFVFEVPYWLNSINYKKYDQIYHEHISYFTIKSLNYLFKKNKLYINDFDIVNYHGGSLRVFVSNIKNNNNVRKKISSQINLEKKSNCFNLDFYKKFSNEIGRDKIKLISRLLALKKKDSIIIAVGAAAKANTFLNYHGLNSSIISFITDTSIHKKGKLTPLSRIKIEDDNIFKNYKNVFALILSWNIADKIKKNLKNINSKIKFISVS